MKLDMALSILADPHTRDDDTIGFVVEAYRSLFSRWSQSEYIEAWETVRKHLHRPVEPATTNDTA